MLVFFCTGLLRFPYGDIAQDAEDERGHEPENPGGTREMGSLASRIDPVMVEKGDHDFALGSVRVLNAFGGMEL